jgi:hypothetical protein
LFTALAAEAGGIPLVVAGPVYDVEYLQTLRAAAPNTIIVADAPAGVVSAFARRASLWIDASPRSRTAAGLIRAIRCGQLPAVAAESPLARIAGPDGAAFALTSVDDAAGTFARALVAPDRAARLAALDHRLGPRGNLARSFGGLLTANARVATVV